MNRNRLIAGIALATLLGVLVSVLVYRQLQRAAAAPRPSPTTHIVVADTSLSPGMRLAAGQLRLLSWPAGDPVPGMLTRTEDCVNRVLIAPVSRNEPILETKLAPKEASAGLPATIPEGMRALSVAVNDVVGVAGFVLPGTMVDVLATGTVPGGVADPVTRTILENVRVLAAGQKTEQDREGKPQTVPVVTLLVSPDQADKLAMASVQGKIQLALRNTIDARVVDPPPIHLRALFTAEEPKKQAARPDRRPVPPVFEVELMLGNKREKKAFPEQQGGSK